VASLVFDDHHEKIKYAQKMPDQKISDQKLSDQKLPEVKKLVAHIFVCTNERPVDHPRSCCQAKNAENLIACFKRELAQAGVAAQVRAQRAGCLDVCEYGPSMVIYPDNIWYGHVCEADVAEIVRSHIVEGCPVDRLRIPGK